MDVDALVEAVVVVGDVSVSDVAESCVDGWLEGLREGLVIASDALSEAVHVGRYCAVWLRSVPPLPFQSPSTVDGAASAGEFLS